MCCFKPFAFNQLRSPIIWHAICCRNDSGWMSDFPCRPAEISSVQAVIRADAIPQQDGGIQVIRAILADDEVLARRKLKQFLRDEPEIEVAGECSTASETIELARTINPDLIFLDIRMPGMDGFDVVEELSASSTHSMPWIVFTTAFDCYALRAFEIHAVDYLLKPFTAERLHTAIRRASEQISTSRRSSEPANGTSRSESRFGTRIVFKSRGRILFLPVSDIRWIGAEENYVRICTGSETHLLRETMTRLEEKLDPSVFMRIHRSSIVNLHFVKEVRSEPPNEFTVVMVNGQKFSMSRSYHSRVSELLAQD
jgi:two-component system, LytTR family, response regulator